MNLSQRETQRHRGFNAFLLHRLSGIALAVFLPLHFLLLGSAIEDAQALDNALAMVDHPLFKVAEWGLVIGLCLHLMFGLRVLMIEYMPWRHATDNRANWIIPSLIGAALVSLVFVLQL